MKRGGTLSRSNGLTRNAKLKSGKRGAQARRVLDRRRRELYDQDAPETNAELALYTATQFWEAARAQRVCAVTRKGGDFEAHHVVEKDYLKRMGRDPWDPRNALRLLTRVHVAHTSAMERVPACCLTDANIEFAFEMLGAGAHFYLRRHYPGYDPRIELALADAEEPPDAAS